MADVEEAALEERMKAALWFSVGKIVDEEALKLGVNATPQFIGALTELLWAQIGNVSQDLRSFARHANRQIIATEDVLLLARRNDDLATVLRSCLEQRNAARPKAAKRP
ncbi:MAG: hypothetical protein Q9182_001595 [Xanthomendoza sp. 2 TL-2023]